MEDTVVFIDGGFFDHVIDAFCPPKRDAQTKRAIEAFRLDYSAFADNLAKLSKGERLRTYYYHCKPINDGSDYYYSKSDFFKGLVRTPRFTFREGKLDKHKVFCKNKECKSHLVCQECGQQQFEIKQKRTDDLLIVDVVSLSWRGLIKRAVFVGGDSDFLPAFNEAKEAGVITYLFCPPKEFSEKTKVHDELFDVFDERIEFTKEMFECCGGYKKLENNQPNR